MDSSSVDLVKDGCALVERCVVVGKERIRRACGWLTVRGQELSDEHLFKGDELFIFCRNEELYGIHNLIDKPLFIVGNDDYAKGAVIGESDDGPLGKIINVWYGRNENPDLSNLAKRPFSLKGRTYISVEHGYQTWKSGKFDEVAYLSINGPGQKGRAIFKVDRSRSARIMKTLMRSSFKQNDDALAVLLETSDAWITHEPEKGYWAVMFPELLMELRTEFKNENTEKKGE